jgi:ABC-type branched-subunit amino acid transport system substrate-binding protein
LVRRRSVAAICLLLLLLTVTTGCGTRLPDSAFERPTPVASTTAGLSSITIGTINSLSNPFDSEAFAGPSYGLRAFVDDVNRRGGIDGRTVVLKSCDDGGSGSENVNCVHRLLDQDKVFALVSSSILNYAGAPIVNARGVPDIGAQPIDLAYTKYQHLWDIGGESYPRNGQIGWNGELHGGTDVYRYFKDAFPKAPLRAGVVYYNQASSKAYGRAMSKGLESEGYSVTTAEINFALPDYDSVAIKFRNHGVRYVYDAIDRGGNERLCKAMDDNQLYVVAKITTTQSWTANVGREYRGSPRCRNSLYATGGTRNYDATGSAVVDRFREAMKRLGWDTPATMSEWALEGWAGGLWFADAATSCGHDLTRTCVEDYLRRPTPYTGHGLLIGRTFTVGSSKLRPHRSCLNVARWQDTAASGSGGWVEQIVDMNKNCFVVTGVAYHP